MTDTLKTQIRAYGIRVLLARHPAIRRLKRKNIPGYHGNKFWLSSWLLMDYFKRRGLKKRAHVMEIGCGWGLAGIYCAKKYEAKVTGVDIDPEVFPFLDLHADLNGVQIKTIRRSFSGLTEKHLKGIDVMIGADICFWDNQVEPLKRLIVRALRNGVRLVAISDPGRPTFDKVAQYFQKKYDGEILDWTARSPRLIQGNILKIAPR
jgi:predicted nicotinamide N-methyase